MMDLENMLNGYMRLLPATRAVILSEALICARQRCCSGELNESEAVALMLRLTRVALCFSAPSMVPAFDAQTATSLACVNVRKAVADGIKRDGSDGAAA